MVFHRSLSENKSPQVSRTLLSILANQNNPVVWVVSARPLISKSSSLFINPLVTVQWVPITIGINVTFTIHSFFNSLVRSRYLSFFSLSFNLIIILIITSFSHQRSLSDSKSPQVSRTHFSIPADLDNAIFWIFTVRPPISNSLNLLIKPLGIVPSAPITIGITVTLLSFFTD